MSAPAARPGELPGTAATPLRLRVFAGAPGQPRYRRASDVLLLVPALAALALLIAAFPPSRLERSLALFLRSLPAWLAPLWEVFHDGLAVWAVALLGAALLLRRPTVLAAALGSIVVAAGVTVVAARLATGGWPDLGELVRLRVDDSTFPVVRTATVAAVVLTVGPHLVRPLRRFGRYLLLLGVLGALLAEEASPSAQLSAFVVALVAAASVRLALGTSAGYPRASDILAAVRGLGIETDGLTPAARQQAGAFVLRGADGEGRPLLVKVVGRDAWDTQLLEKAWRTIMYQGEGPRARLSRLEAVEHEALACLLTRQAGVPTHEVVTAAESPSGDAILVLRGDTQPLAVPDDARAPDLAGAWQALIALGQARIAHHRIDADSVVSIDGRTGIVELERATLSAPTDQLLLDRAQLLATTAALAGVEPALASAMEAIGREGVAELLPYLQRAAFGPALRRALDTAGIDVDELRHEAADASAAVAPEPVKLRRVTVWSVVQLGLLVFAVSTVIGALTGLDYEALGGYLEDALWGWVVLGAVVAQLPRVSQAVATLGSVPSRLPFLSVYVMQLATGYLNLALPSNLARMALNIRFFQRQGMAPATVVTAGVIDSFASTVAQILLLVTLLAFSATSLELDFETPSGPPVLALVVMVALAVAVLATLWLVRRIRETIVERVRQWWPEVRATLGSLRSGHKLALVLGGSVATEILFAVALGTFARALGTYVSLPDLLLINISTSLLATLMPVPGGIGIAEFGLTVGLSAAGMPEEAALATALLYRAATFYVPPTWGFFAMRWLQRNDHL